MLTLNQVGISRDLILGMAELPREAQQPEGTEIRNDHQKAVGGKGLT